MFAAMMQAANAQMMADFAAMMQAANAQMMADFATIMQTNNAKMTAMFMDKFKDVAQKQQQSQPKAQFLFSMSMCSPSISSEVPQASLRRPLHQELSLRGAHKELSFIQQYELQSSSSKSSDGARRSSGFRSSRRQVFDPGW